MSYTAKHKQETRERIIESARELFNRKGFSVVTVKEIMKSAGLTHGGFYNHFSSKDELFVEAIEAYGKCNPTDRWPSVTFDFSLQGKALVEQLLNAYLSKQHLNDIDGQCPLIALPSDIARAGPKVRNAYEESVKNMLAVFEGMDARKTKNSRQQSLNLIALCIGGMVLARTLDNKSLAEEIRQATHTAAMSMTE